MTGMRFKLYHEAVGEVELEHAPVGWDGLRYKLLRDKVYHGVTREFTVELEFVKDGFEYIHTIYEAYGIRANILIFVYEENPHNMRYELAYQGILALEKWRVLDGEGSKARRGITNIDFMGFTQRFVNGEDVEVNINSLQGIFGHPVPLHPTVPVSLHSQSLKQTYDGRNTIQVRQLVGTLAGSTKQENRPSSGYTLFGFDEVKNNDLQVFNYQTGVNNISSNIGKPHLNLTPAPELFTAMDNGEFNLSIDLRGVMEIVQNGTLTGDEFYTAYYGIYIRVNEEEPTLLWEVLQEDEKRDLIAHFTVSKELKLQLEAGDKVSLYGYFYITSFDGRGDAQYDFPLYMTLERNSMLKIDATTTSAAYETDGVLIFEAFSTICSSITGYPRAFASDFFGRTDSFPIQYPKDGEGSGLMLANGFKLRGLDYARVLKFWEMGNGLLEFFGKEPLPKPENDGKYDIFTSFKELFLAVDAIWCMGAGIELVNGEMVVRVEKRSHFYNNDIVLDLGKVSALEKSVSTDDYYNEAEFGYKEWKIESDNGLLEFNTKHHYTIPNEKVKRKYSAVSTIIAAGYRLEKAKRQRLLASEDADTKDDDQKFFICMERSEGQWVSEQGSEKTVEGITNSDTAFNMRINPVAMMGNHLPVLKQAFYKHPEDAALRFNKGEGTFSYSLTGLEGTIQQGGKDVLHKDMPEAISIPEVYKFKYKLNHHQLRTLRENPYGIIRFRDQYNNTLMGHLQEVDATAANGLSEFTLKRAYDA